MAPARTSAAPGEAENGSPAAAGVKLYPDQPITRRLRIHVLTDTLDQVIWSGREWHEMSEFLRSKDIATVDVVDRDALIVETWSITNRRKVIE